MLRPGASSTLLLLTACGGGAAPGATSSGPDAAPPETGWLIDVTAASGVDFVQESGARGDWILTEIMGGGGALLDADGDGHLDLVLLQGGREPGSPDTAQAGSGHRLYLGDGGLRFRDATVGSGLEDLSGYAMSAAVGDVDDDGRPDLYVSQHGADRLLLNRGGGRFEDVTAAWGAGVEGWSTAAVFGDVDQDGDLDLFVARYIELDPGLECRDGSGRRTYCPPTSGVPLHDVLLLQEGGRFVDVSREAGLAARAAPGLGVVVEDLTGDGRPDVYVANDGAENHLWTRGADGRWRDEGLARGAALNLNGQAEASMGVVAEDLDGDLVPDLFMTHLSNESHTLYRARRGGFADETGRSGLLVPTKPGTGFGVAALDLGLDGDLDLLVAQGRVDRAPPLPGAALPSPWDEFAEPDLLLENDGAGYFRAAPERAPALTSPVTVDRGVLTGDLDGDGDRDVVVTRLEGPPLILRNDSPSEGRALVVDPRARPGGVTAIGARVLVEWRAPGRAGRAARTARASDGYLTSRDPRVDVTITWPSGAREAFAGQVLPAAPGAALVLVRGTGEAR